MKTNYRASLSGSPRSAKDGLSEASYRLRTHKRTRMSRRASDPSWSEELPLEVWLIGLVYVASIVNALRLLAI